MATFTITTEVIWRSPGISSIPKSQGGNTNGAATMTMKSPKLTQTPSSIQEYMSLLTYLVSTCAAERSFSGIKRLKTPLRNTMGEERLSSLAILHIHKHKNVDIDNVISELSRRKGRRLTLFL